MLQRTLYILAFLLLWGIPAFAVDVVVVQGEHMAPFEEALRGFLSTAGVQSTERLVLEGNKGMDVVRAVREARPRLVLAVGKEALARVKNIREIPIVYMMVVNPEQSDLAAGNTTGVSLNVAPERYLSVARKAVAGRRVGVVYNQAKSGGLVKLAKNAAAEQGMNMVTGEAHSGRDVLPRLERMKDNVDVLCLFPDPTVVTRDTLEGIFLFSLQNRVPVVAFAPKYLKDGAVAAFDVDSYALGRQTGDMARRILNGAAVGTVPPEFAVKATLKINPTVARNLGISPDSLKE